jgi:hypothetical protein
MESIGNSSKLAKKRIDMKPIKLKITPDQILALEKLLEDVLLKPAIKIDEKLTKSILSDVAEKVHKMYRDILKSRDLFNEKKKKSIQLKWHEGGVLSAIILYSLQAIPATEKAHNDLLMLSNDLHKEII